MNKNKVFSVIIEVSVLISLYVLGLIQKRITSIKMLAAMSIFFGLAAILARIIERFVDKKVLGNMPDVEIPKVTWILYRATCVILAFLVFTLVGYSIKHFLGNPSVILRYSGASAIFHIIMTYYSNLILRIGRKSPFDLEDEKYFEEMDIEIKNLHDEIERLKSE